MSTATLNFSNDTLGKVISGINSTLNLPKKNTHSPLLLQTHVDSDSATVKAASLFLKNIEENIAKLPIDVIDENKANKSLASINFNINALESLTSHLSECGEKGEIIMTRNASAVIKSLTSAKDKLEYLSDYITFALQVKKAKAELNTETSKLYSFEDLVKVLNIE